MKTRGMAWRAGRWWAVLAALAGGAAAHGQTFSANFFSPIPDSGRAGTYPMNIVVAGVADPLVRVQVQLIRLDHTFPGDLDIVLVAPDGTAVLLMSDVGGGTDVGGANITFDAEAPAAPAVLVSGTYAPTDVNDGTADPMLPPCPEHGGNTSLAGLAGIDPNGTWSLYVLDDAAADTGGLLGWSVIINPPYPPPSQGAAITYQGVLESAGAAYSGGLDLRLGLWDHPTSVSPGNRKGVVEAGAEATGGRFSVLADFGMAAFDGGPRWLEVAVRAPAGEGEYEVLAPRQLATPAAEALVARRALEIPGPARVRGPLEVFGAANQSFFNAESGVRFYRTDPGTPVGAPYTTAAPEYLFAGFTNRSSQAFAFLMNSSLSEPLMTFDVGTRQVAIGSLTASSYKLFVAGTVGCTSVTQFSSVELKQDIGDSPHGLADLLQLRPVAFTWRDDAPEEVRGTRDFGFLAHEVAEVLPEAVKRDARGKAIGVDYARVGVVAVTAIRELRAEKDREVAALRAELAARDEALARLAERLERLEGGRK